MEKGKEKVISKHEHARPRMAPPARNYGARNEGGDAYAMGEEVNRMMRVYWKAYQQDLEAMRSTENPFIRKHHRYNIENRWKVALRLLASIRKAGRVSA